MKNKFFIVSYTHNVKRYCDEKFINNLKNIEGIPETQVTILSNGTKDYHERLVKLCEGSHFDLIYHPVKVLGRKLVFEITVYESVNLLRDLFLKTDKDYFLIIESDVIPPSNVLDLFLEVVDNYDIIGGIYYKGFHNKKSTGIEKVGHVLSGCTLYKRKVIEQVPFRYSKDKPGCFPDAFISRDAGKLGFSLVDYYKIQCEHAHTSSGFRRVIG